MRTYLSAKHPIPDPVTEEDIRGKHMIENINLRQFIQSWPSFYEQQEKLSGNTLSHAIMG